MLILEFGMGFGMCSSFMMIIQSQLSHYPKSHHF